MKGMPGRIMRGLPVGSRIKCADNSGARIVQIVSVPRGGSTHRRSSSAGIGDMIIGSVKKGKPEMKQRLVNAVIVRQKRPFRRPDGVMVEFEDNAVVLVTPEGDVRGSRIKGPVSRESAERWPKIAAIASIIV